MAFIAKVSVDQPTTDVRQLYQAAAQRAGDVAQIIQVMSNDGKSATASMGLYLAVMKQPNGLSGAQREMLATVVSNANDCFY